MTVYRDSRAWTNSVGVVTLETCRNEVCTLVGPPFAWTEPGYVLVPFRTAVYGASLAYGLKAVGDGIAVSDIGQVEVGP